MNNFIKVKPGPPEEKAPKGTKCYNLLEGVVYEQVDGLKKNRWDKIANNVNLDAQMLIRFLFNKSENIVDLEGSSFQSNNSDSGNTYFPSGW